MKYKSVDLFAGIGGIRLGFEQAFGTDIETVYVCECDKYAQKTYRENFNDNFDIAEDITKVNEKDIPGFDILLAGFPCQPFSIAGTGGNGRRGFDDEFKGKNRGNLFLDVVRIGEHHKPKVIFCENVKGLVTHDRGKTFRKISGNPRLFNCRDESAKRNKARKEHLFWFFLPCLLLCDILYV